MHKIHGSVLMDCLLNRNYRQLCTLTLKAALEMIIVEKSYLEEARKWLTRPDNYLVQKKECLWGNLAVLC